MKVTLVGKTYQRIVQYDAARLKTASNVDERLMETLDLIKRSTDITMLLGSRIKSVQVFDVPGIGYLITICISNSI